MPSEPTDRKSRDKSVALFAAAQPAPPAFLAWRRPHGGRWQAVASGATEAEASKALHEIMKQDRSGSFDSQVLPRGERP
jgi:hypothetical protein